MTLSAKYSSETWVKMEYVQNRKNMFFQEVPAEKLNVKVKTTGFKLIYLYFFPKKITLYSSDFKHATSYKYYFLPNKNLFKFQPDWHAIEIQQFEKDSIFLSLGKFKSKTIPVISQVNAYPKAGYLLHGGVTISPDSITVSAPEKYLDSVSYVTTEKMELTDLKSDFSKKVALEIKPHLVYSDSMVTITGNLSKYTELKMKLPILINTKHADNKTYIFPETAVLYYQIGFEDYDKIKNSEFELSVDIPAVNTEITRYLPVYLSKKPDFITIYRIEPEYVNYIIEK